MPHNVRVSTPPRREVAEYVDAIERVYVGLRRSGFVLAPSDRALVETWARRGVPLRAVCAALVEGAARWRETHGDAKPLPGSLRFFRKDVERAARRAAEQHPWDGAQRPVGGDAPHRATRLQRALRAWQSAAPAWAAEAAGPSLAALRAGASGEGGPFDWGDVARWWDALLDALWRAAPSELHAAVEARCTEDAPSSQGDFPAASATAARVRRARRHAELVRELGLETVEAEVWR